MTNLIDGTSPDMPLRPAINILAKPIGPVCNLACQYCYYLDKKRHFPERHKFRMTDEVLETYIRRYIEAEDGPQVSFYWQGGEPTLLGLEFFERVIALQQRYRRAGQRIANAIQSNGTLLTDAWCRFFAKHQFLVGLSLDGPPGLHDTYRRNRRDRPTHGHVVRALDRLQRHEVAVNTLTVVSNANAHRPLAVYRHLKALGVGHMQFIPLVERVDGAGQLMGPPAPDADIGTVAEFCPRAEDYGRFINAIFDEWVGQDVGRIFVQMFDLILARTLGQPPGLCVFAETCGGNLAMEHDGDLYACDHYVYPEFRFGNVADGPLHQSDVVARLQEFGLMKKHALPRQCQDCRELSFCFGGCPKHRFLHTGEGEWGLNYLCAGYRRIFAHTRPAMRRMAAHLRQGRPAAAIMAPAGKIGRNTLCPCGSGLKYKKCCGGDGKGTTQ